METYNSKYIKTWGEFLKEHPNLDEKEKEAMKAKIESSEKAVFDYIINLLL
jgi:hypothetical protein